MMIREKYYKRKVGIIGSENMRKYAVLVPLFYKNNEIYVLFEKRSEDLSVQPGEISFPGGGLEDGEDFKKAALRETCEELLISKENVHILTDGDIDIGFTGRMVQYFIGYLDNYQGTYSKAEVDSTFSIPLKELKKIKPKKLENRLVVKADPEFPFEEMPNGRNYRFLEGLDNLLFYRYNDHLIWGLTARILNSALTIIEELL